MVNFSSQSQPRKDRWPPCQKERVRNCVITANSSVCLAAPEERHGGRGVAALIRAKLFFAPGVQYIKAAIVSRVGCSNTCFKKAGCSYILSSTSYFSTLTGVN